MRTLELMQTNQPTHQPLWGLQVEALSNHQTASVSKAAWAHLELERLAMSESDTLSEMVRLQVSWLGQMEGGGHAV